MAYNRETKRWTRKSRLSRGEKATLARAPFRRDARDNFGSTLKRAKREAGRGLHKVGKKGRAWAKARRELKVVFAEQYGITLCEGEYVNCTFDDFLSFAHRLKRRNIVTEEDLKDCLLLCFNCHWEIERGGEERMKVLFDEIKARRAA